MRRLMVLGLNHASASLAVRERLAFNAEQRNGALSSLKLRFPQCQAVLLSTCNRMELYVAREPHESPSIDEIVRFLGDLRQVPQEEFQPLLYIKREWEAVEHLFRVASSLDSMVLGETQILGQVREAYDSARQLGSTGSLLNPLFQRAIAVAKQVMSQTSLSEGRVSVAAIAVEYARRIFNTFADKTVLNIGAGKMATLVLANLATLSPGTLLVCNRDPIKSAALAQRFNGRSVSFEGLPEHLGAADIIVSSTGSTQPIITRPLLESALRRRRYRPVFMIDIALPRDVAPDVAELDNVYLYNLDDLQQVAGATRSQRSSAIEAANKIIDEQVRQFISWHHTRQFGPIIDQLYRRSHALAQEELSRTLGKLDGISPAEKEHLEDLARRIVNKLLHDPIQMLRQSDGLHAPSARYLHAMEKLFKLDDARDPTDPGAGDDHPAQPQ